MKRVHVAVATLDLGNVSGRLVTLMMAQIVALVIAGYASHIIGDMLRVGVSGHFAASPLARY